MGKIVLGNDRFAGETILPKYESDTYPDGLGIRLKPQARSFDFHKFLQSGLDDLVELTSGRAMAVIETEVDFSAKDGERAPIYDPDTDMDDQHIFTSDDGKVGYWKASKVVNEGPNGLFYHVDRGSIINMLTPANGSAGVSKKMTNMRGRPDTVVAPLREVDHVFGKWIGKLWDGGHGIKHDNPDRVREVLEMARSYAGKAGKNTLAYVSNFGELSNAGNPFLMEEMTDCLEKRGALLRHSWSTETVPTVLVFSGEQPDFSIDIKGRAPKTLHGRMPAKKKRGKPNERVQWSGALYFTDLA